jgi:hypothetical protein
MTSSADSSSKTTSFEVYVAKEDFKFHAAHFVGEEKEYDLVAYNAVWQAFFSDS